MLGRPVPTSVGRACPRRVALQAPPGRAVTLLPACQPCPALAARGSSSLACVAAHCGHGGRMDVREALGDDGRLRVNGESLCDGRKGKEPRETHSAPRSPSSRPGGLAGTAGRAFAHAGCLARARFCSVVRRFHRCSLFASVWSSSAC